MTNDSAQLAQLSLRSAISIFDHKLSGFRFQPPLPGEMSDADLGHWLGAHNADAIVFRDREGEQIMGIKLFCQCETCLLSQADFCLRQQVEIIGQGERSTSIVFDDSGGVQFLQRSRSELEDQIDARRAAERQRDLAEKNALRAEIKRLEKKFEAQQAQTGGLVRDKNGRVWTRNQLMAMSASQQRED